MRKGSSLQQRAGSKCFSYSLAKALSSCIHQLSQTDCPGARAVESGAAEEGVTVEGAETAPLLEPATTPAAGTPESCSCGCRAAAALSAFALLLLLTLFAAAAAVIEFPPVSRTAASSCFSLLFSPSTSFRRVCRREMKAPAAGSEVDHGAKRSSIVELQSVLPCKAFEEQ